jgi:hypothetical protein
MAKKKGVSSEAVEAVSEAVEVVEEVVKASVGTGEPMTDAEFLKIPENYAAYVEALKKIDHTPGNVPPEEKARIIKSLK